MQVLTADIAKHFDTEDGKKQEKKEKLNLVHSGEYGMFKHSY